MEKQSTRLSIKQTLAHVSRSKMFRWVAIAYFVIIIVAGVLTYWSGYREYASVEALRSLDFMYELDIQISDLQNQLFVIEDSFESISNFQSTDPERIQLLLDQLRNLESIDMDGEGDYESRLTAIENVTSQMTAQVESLRSALFPARPEEVLAVARLGDRFIALDQDVMELREEIGRVERTFEIRLQEILSALNAQVDRIVNMMSWIGLLFIPILINAIRDIVRLRTKEGDNVEVS